MKASTVMLMDCLGCNIVRNAVLGKKRRWNKLTYPPNPFGSFPPIFCIKTF